MVYITGDCHADFSRFTTKNFPEQKELHRKDTVLICGDFGGVWYDNAEERNKLDWLSKKPYTTCFVDGNHENFDRLYSSEFPVVDFHGGKAHKIRNGVYHLMRGDVFDFEGKTFFCMGGASSHDIRDGILDPEDFTDIKYFKREHKNWVRQGKQFRINHVSWWKEELPDELEMDRAFRELKKHNMKVDYVVSHCLPTSVASAYSGGWYKQDRLTNMLENLLSAGLVTKEWHCGHYHKIDRYDGSTYCRPYSPIKYYFHYQDIMRLL